MHQVDGDSTAPSVQNPILIWNGERQENQQRIHYPQSPQHPPAFDIPHRVSQQNKLEKEWNERMECLNEKYNLDYYSGSKSDSDCESEHKYETLI